MDDFNGFAVSLDFVCGVFASVRFWFEHWFVLSCFRASIYLFCVNVDSVGFFNDFEAKIGLGVFEGLRNADFFRFRVEEREELLLEVGNLKDLWLEESEFRELVTDLVLLFVDLEFDPLVIRSEVVRLVMAGRRRVGKGRRG